MGNGKRYKIKVHSFICNKLPALLFNDMITYVWFASKLAIERNVKSDVTKMKCDCEN